MPNTLVNIIVVILVLAALFLAYWFFIQEPDSGLPTVTTVSPTADNGDDVEFISLLNQLRNINLQTGVLPALRTGRDSVNLPNLNQVPQGRDNPFFRLGTLNLGPGIDPEPAEADESELLE